jgi:hypothetical protein
MEIEKKLGHETNQEGIMVDPMEDEDREGVEIGPVLKDDDPDLEPGLDLTNRFLTEIVKTVREAAEDALRGLPRSQPEPEHLHLFPDIDDDEWFRA